MERPADLATYCKVAYYPQGIELKNTRNVCIRLTKRKYKYIVTYLDENSICRESKFTITQLRRGDIVLDNLGVCDNFDHAYFIEFKDIFEPVGISPIDDNTILHNKLLRRLQIGEHASKLHEYALTTYLKEPIRHEYSDVERMFQKICKPTIVKCRRGFEYVKVTVNCATYVTKADINANMKYLTTATVDKIQNDRSFQRYGVPVTLLNLCNVILTTSHQLEFTYELKKELRELFSS